MKEKQKYTDSNIDSTQLLLKARHKTPTNEANN